MTDGIIQNIFNKYIYSYSLQMTESKEKVEPRKVMFDLIKIQQELLQQIEKKFPEHNDDRKYTSQWNKAMHYAIKEIIGDNQ